MEVNIEVGSTPRRGCTNVDHKPLEVARIDMTKRGGVL